MCPLRVILILLSAIVALLALLYTAFSNDDNSKSKSPSRSPKQLLIDFMTGRYLYNFYKTHFAKEPSSDGDVDVDADIKTEGQPGHLTEDVSMTSSDRPKDKNA